MRGFLYTAILCSLPSLSFGLSTCFQRIAQLEQIVGAAQFEFPATQAELQGIETDRRYTAHWEAKAYIHDGSLVTQIDFRYEESEGRDASIRVRFDNEQETAAYLRTTDGRPLVEGANRRLGKPHRVTFDLPRNEAGALLDLNIAHQVLSHIAEKSEADESYQFILNDPSGIDKLNEILGEALRAVHFNGDFPRRSGSKEGDPLDQLYFYDRYSESYFANLSLQDFQELLQNLNSDADFQKELVKVFASTPLGEMISRSGKWKIEIGFVETDLVKSLNLHETELYPLVYKYRIRLHRR